MKRITLIIICFIAASLYTTVYGRNREPYKPKHEITVRWGVVDEFFNDDFWSDWGWNQYYTRTPLERYNNGKYYWDDKKYTQAISLSYTHEIKRWLSLSINATYSGISQNERRREDNRIVSEYKKHRLGIFPMVKFTYFNRPVVRLYSAVGLGVGLKTENWSNTSKNKINETHISGQATFFGVSVGKRLFASWEVGAGAMGYFVMCGGYRF
jgi:hypothetical protein